jgi:uncharacterized glyoxalase superfamily protein PhnB
MTVKKMTSILFVPEVEPCVAFWMNRLGFEKTAEVPNGDKLAFAMLQKGGVELMYQSFASAEHDAPEAYKNIVRGPSFLYVEVDNLGEFVEAVKGAEVFMPVRDMFYGAKEISIRDPGGHVVTFAQFG